MGGDGFADGEGAVYDITGSQTEEGNSPNDFTYTLNANTKADNYEITTTPGTLTVTKSTKALVITSGTETWTYDGEKHTYQQYTVTYGDDETIVGDEGQNRFTLSTGDWILIYNNDTSSVFVQDVGTKDNSFEYILYNDSQ